MSAHHPFVFVIATTSLVLGGVLVLGYRRSPVHALDKEREASLDQLCMALRFLSNDEWAIVKRQLDNFLGGASSNRSTKGEFKPEVDVMSSNRPAKEEIAMPRPAIISRASETIALTTESEIKESSVQNASNQGHTVDLTKFKTMLKVGIDPGAVKSKMISENIDPRLLFGESENPPIQPEGNRSSSSVENETRKDPRFSKYETMLKVGINPEAVRSKMKSDGFDPSLLFSRGESATKPKLIASALGDLIPCDTLSSASLWTQSTSRGTMDVDTERKIEAMFRAAPVIPKSSRPFTMRGENDENEPPTNAMPGKKPMKKLSSVRPSILLPARRAQNLQIGLARFKLEPETICHAVLKMEPEVFGRKGDDDNLQLLLRLLPTEEERKMLGEYHGDESKLSDVERLFRMFSLKVPDVTSRVEGMIFVVRFPSQVKDLRAEMNVIHRALDIVTKSAALISLLQITLKVGMTIANVKASNVSLSVHGLAQKMTRAKTPDGKITAADVVAGLFGREDALPLMEPSFANFRPLNSIQTDLDEMEKAIQRKRVLSDDSFVAGAVKEWSLLKEQFMELKRYFSLALAHFGEPIDRGLNIFFTDLCDLVGAIQASLVTNKFKGSEAD